MISEQKFLFDDIHVKYRFKQSESDRSHLLIIFSGFHIPVITGYDFNGEAYKGYKGNILWIKDDFNDLCSYYLCQNMDFIIERAVIALIDNILGRYGLQKSQCTLAGFSKGGTAALYFGIKYGFANILSTVPQFSVGSYVKRNWSIVAQNMMGEDVNNNVLTLDSLLSDLIDQDCQLERNIYLFSSLSDIQYELEIKPNLQRLQKYQNFNLVMTDSDLVRQHNHVTRYNMPLILSILYALCEGVAPRYGAITDNGGKGRRENSFPTSKKSIVATLSKCDFKNNHFFPEGAAFILGEDSSCYGLQKKTFLLRSKSGGEYRFIIGSVINNDLSNSYFKTKYIDYTTGGFASLGHNGIDLSGIPYGVYDLSIEITSKTYEGASDLITDKRIDIRHSESEVLYYTYSIAQKVMLVKRDILGQYHDDTFFKVTNHWLKNKMYHIEGVFRISGIELAEWGDAHYFLVLKSQKKTATFPLGMCHREFITSQHGDGFANYNKAYFSTMEGKGVNISSLPSGSYDVYISMLRGNALFTVQANERLNID